MSLDTPSVPLGSKITLVENYYLNNNDFLKINDSNNHVMNRLLIICKFPLIT